MRFTNYSNLTILLMKKTSAAVLALLFSSSKAVKLRDGDGGVPGYEAVSAEAEGVHVLDLGMHTMSNSPKDAPEFAFPNIRTAFYLQTGSELEFDKQNGLWRQSLSQRAPRRDFDTAVLSPPEGQIGTDVYEHTMDT